MANTYLLNGVDMKTAYGFVASDGSSNDILRSRKRKDPYANDWPEFNGKEYDLASAPKYEDRQIRLSGHIVAKTQAEFWTKKDALFTALNQTGTKQLRCVAFGTTKDVNIFYLDMPICEIVSGFFDTSKKVIARIEILLQEVQQY